jgi:hypothetical protein
MESSVLVIARSQTQLTAPLPFRRRLPQQLLQFLPKVLILFLDRVSDDPEFFLQVVQAFVYLL